ncbi:GTP-binding protein chloroplastic [Dorcoceras hygrometricum]|uniref:GTP-binding protein chloroplastic n=1 Tax=Dorcoceras hygrometricum TaxID=472368 RepID=A0A2Z7BD84_9LAMI|nr:GTP-binding protein chloroplastic [Dorcoceras hygrometricum]
MLRTIVHRHHSAITPSTSIASDFPALLSRFSASPILQGRQHDGDGDEVNSDPDAPPRLFVVQPRLRPQNILKAKLEEALNLANSLDQQRDGFYQTEFLDKEIPPHVVVQNPTAKSPRADTYFGVGTVSTVQIHMNELESKHGVDAIFVNAILSGIQQRNLEASLPIIDVFPCFNFHIRIITISFNAARRAWGKPVLDRVGLIIEIFNAHAQTKEAKLQAELAALMYKKSRLVRVRGLDGRYTFGGVGEAEVVSARGRGSGGRGFISGAGETELQLQRRRILDRRNKLLSEIKDVRRTRAVQRASRKRQGGSQGQEIATVAVVGYTNAGKSTLVSALTDSYLYCDDRLFATVDPKLSSVLLPSGRKVLLSDTVGFISDLPVQLVEAFHATLEEVVEADLLVHVLDSSAPNLDEHRETVLQVLGQIGVPDEKLHNMIEVWNKVDLQETEMDLAEHDGEDFLSNSSGEDTSDVASNQLCVEHNNDQDMKSQQLSSEEVGSGGEANDTDGWLSCREEQESWVDYDSCSVGSEAADNQQKELSWDWRASDKRSQSQPKSTVHAKTSAVTGVGLAELLELIDEKLPNMQVVERSIFDRKWRPPREADTKVAVRQ